CCLIAFIHAMFVEEDMATALLSARIGLFLGGAALATSASLAHTLTGLSPDPEEALPRAPIPVSNRGADSSGRIEPFPASPSKIEKVLSEARLTFEGPAVDDSRQSAEPILKAAKPDLDSTPQVDPERFRTTERAQPKPAQPVAELEAPPATTRLDFSDPFQNLLPPPTAEDEPTPHIPMQAPEWLKRPHDSHSEQSPNVAPNSPATFSASQPRYRTNHDAPVSQPAGSASQPRYRPQPEQARDNAAQGSAYKPWSPEQHQPVAESSPNIAVFRPNEPVPKPKPRPQLEPYPGYPGYYMCPHCRGGISLEATVCDHCKGLIG
ncbi:MAG: hypothetical protein KC561_15245, partial [Myxococcales bacterium]|nr:hypothetical protein [Myxococcales bacterium]